MENWRCVGFSDIRGLSLLKLCRKVSRSKYGREKNVSRVNTDDTPIDGKVSRWTLGRLIMDVTETPVNPVTVNL